MPARIVPKNYRHLTGLVYNSRTSTMTAFESSLERDFLLLLDFDPDVEYFEEQPVTILYQDDQGRHHRYTPDVFVRFRSDRTASSGPTAVLYEVKYRDDLRQHWREYKVKFKAACRYAKGQGWRFRLMTEREIRTAYLENVKFLRPYRYRNADAEHLTSLLERLRTLRATTPAALIVALSDDVWHQAQLLSAVWHLVALRQVGTDLSQPLMMHSPLWALTSEGGDA
jgi:hypothetical protein